MLTEILLLVNPEHKKVSDIALHHLVIHLSVVLQVEDSYLYGLNLFQEVVVIVNDLKFDMEV